MPGKQQGKQKAHSNPGASKEIHVKHLIMISGNAWRNAKSLQHANRLLTKLNPKLPAEAISFDGEKFYRWNRETLRLELRSEVYVMRSEQQRGYWKAEAAGWVPRVRDATLFSYADKNFEDFMVATLGDAQLVILDDSLRDFV